MDLDRTAPSNAQAAAFWVACRLTTLSSLPIDLCTDFVLQSLRVLEHDFVNSSPSSVPGRAYDGALTRSKSISNVEQVYKAAHAVSNVLPSLKDIVGAAGMAGFRRHAPLVPPPEYVSNTNDVETASVRSGQSADSQAPSYASDRPPSYRRGDTDHSDNTGTVRASATSCIIEEHQQAASAEILAASPQIGLPDLQYAPGFRPLREGDIRRDLLLPSLSMLHSSHGSRQYRNVALRRQRQPLVISMTAAPTTSAASLSAAAPQPHSIVDSVSTTTQASWQDNLPNTVEPPSGQNHDRDCSGEDRRSELDALHHDSASWNFMLGQMSDWGEREKNWGHFRTKVAEDRSRVRGRVLNKKVTFGLFKKHTQY